MSSFLSWALGLGFFLLYAFRRFAFRRRLPLPPGPKPLPVIGNVLDLPTSRDWLTFTEWGRKYNSPLIYADALGQGILIVNSPDDAVGLLEERAQSTSDRPYFPLFFLMGLETNTANLSYGTLWRKHRKVLHQSMKKDAVERHQPILVNQASQLLRNIAKDPSSFMRYCKIYSGSLVLDIYYGYDRSSDKDPFFLRAEDAVVQISRAILPGAFAVNAFPLLRYVPRWFPGAGFQDWAANAKRLIVEARNFPFDLAKANPTKDDGTSTLVGQWLQERVLEPEDEPVLRDVAGSAFIAGIDTTYSSLVTLFLALTLYPDVQRKAREEILRVVGTNRLPNLQDRPSLPYLDAIFREILRWRPPVPLGIPHKVSRDEVYNGHFIPAGTIILTNYWAMTRDESLHPDPEEFRPERFLNSDGTLKPGTDRPYAFGFGRRVCPGRLLAADSIWIPLAQVITMFNITKAKDEYGNDIQPSLELTDEGATCPDPFQCNIVLRREYDDWR
ncbi:cytochrome P450 [Pluteus cervinus]|uniref:Cytochrome P450 n=1 Tax=Pluteus cervinus TaxID=181527 RepID=A0ACD3AJJ0_9AGAR|nr:cytochrome P450 [Pluteus cervinus]